MALWLKIVIAILLPPLAVFLQVGLSFHFLLNLILWICFYFPGLAHAIWILVRKQ